MKAKIGILTVSDRASAGVYEDLSGKAIIETLNAYLSCEWESVYKVIPDEQPLIEAALEHMADHDQCCLIVTTGGTGPALRDVTPEATEAPQAETSSTESEAKQEESTSERCQSRRQP